MHAGSTRTRRGIIIATSNRRNLGRSDTKVKRKRKVIDFGPSRRDIGEAHDRRSSTSHDQVTHAEVLSPSKPRAARSTRAPMSIRLGGSDLRALTGSTTVRCRHSARSVYSEVQRVIREVERRNLRRDCASRSSLASVAARRRVEPKRLARSCAASDWIVMKALEKDRPTRYETASGLALDVQRYLSGDDRRRGAASAFIAAQSVSQTRDTVGASRVPSRLR